MQTSKMVMKQAKINLRKVYKILTTQQPQNAPPCLLVVCPMQQYKQRFGSDDDDELTR